MLSTLKYVKGIDLILRVLIKNKTIIKSPESQPMSQSTKHKTPKNTGWMLLKVITIFLNLNIVMVLWVYIYVHTHQNVYIKCM